MIPCSHVCCIANPPIIRLTYRNLANPFSYKLGCPMMVLACSLSTAEEREGEREREGKRGNEKEREGQARRLREREEERRTKQRREGKKEQNVPKLSSNDINILPN
jgi:hypothetical protein